MFKRLDHLWLIKQYAISKRYVRILIPVGSIIGSLREDRARSEPMSMLNGSTYRSRHSSSWLRIARPRHAYVRRRRLSLAALISPFSLHLKFRRVSGRQAGPSPFPGFPGFPQKSGSFPNPQTSRPVHQASADNRDYRDDHIWVGQS